ncbi:LysR family transcriptional regulator, partial [Escherichia coli]|nr:LysR family transcriptional regulator [Escherichia coli]
VDVFGAHVRAPARYMLLSRNPDDQRSAAFSDWLKAECVRFGEDRSRVLSKTERPA